MDSRQRQRKWRLTARLNDSGEFDIFDWHTGPTVCLTLYEQSESKAEFVAAESGEFDKAAFRTVLLVALNWIEQEVAADGPSCTDAMKGHRNGS